MEILGLLMSYNKVLFARLDTWGNVGFGLNVLINLMRLTTMVILPGPFSETMNVLF